MRRLAVETLVGAIVLASATARADDVHLAYGRPKKVNVLHGGKGNWAPLALHDALAVDDQVSTLHDQTADLAFSNGSSVQLGSEAWVTILNTKPDAVELVDGIVHTDGPVRVHAGDIDAISTGETWTRFDKKTGRFTVAVVAGKADIIARGERTTVLLGSGLTVEKSQQPGKPAPLLRRPAWSAPGDVDVAITAGEPAVPHLAWAAVDGAAHYRVEIARDTTFDDHLTDTVVDAPAPPDLALAPGAYVARVTPETAGGDFGMPSVRRIQIIKLAVQNGRLEGGALSGVGKIQVQLGDDATLGMLLDGQPASSPAVVGPGAHELALVPSAGGAPLTTIPVKVVAPKARVDLVPSGRVYQATITLVDDVGAPIAADDSPALTLEGREGSVADLPAFDADAHVWRATVTPYAGASKRVASVVARWAGEPIGEAVQDVEIVSAVDARAPRVPAGPTEPMLVDPIGQPGASEGAPFPTPWRTRGVAIALRMQNQLLDPTASTIGPRLALDALVPFNKTALFASLSGATSPTSASSLDAGVRQQLVEHDDGRGPILDGAASLDLTLPLSGGQSLVRLRPLVGFGVAPRGPLWLSTEQGASIAPNNAGGFDEAAYAADFVASMRLGPKLVVTAALDLLAGKLAVEKSTSFATAVAAGAGIYYRLGPVDLGVAIRDGIHGAGEDTWGRLSTVLSLAYHR